MVAGSWQRTYVDRIEGCSDESNDLRGMHPLYTEGRLASETPWLCSVRALTAAALMKVHAPRDEHFGISLTESVQRS
jgi:hypothetical protein